MVFACDDAYAKLCGVALQSLLNSVALSESPLPDDLSIVVYVVDLGIHDASLEKLRRIASHEYALSVSLVFLSLQIFEAMQPVLQAQDLVYHPQCFATFFLTELLPEECDRVIFLDCDILVRRSIFDLWQVELGDYALAAARDICSDARRLKGFWRRSCHPTHLAIALCSYMILCLTFVWTKDIVEASKPILNSGVMLMDIAKLRAMDFKESVMDLSVKYLHCSRGSGDQDMISLFLKGHYMELPYEWNTQFFLSPPFHVLLLTEQERADVISQGPRIVHFNGPISRPWINSNDPEHPFHAEWIEVLDSTPWAGCRPTNTATSIWTRLCSQHHAAKDLNGQDSGFKRGRDTSIRESASLIGNPHGS